MMALPHRGLVWLSMPKCASTAVETVLEPHARLVMRGEFKHTNYSAFTRLVEPILDGGGHRRSSYEVVCLFRDPLSWLESWWRYRSRPELKQGPKAHNYTGDMSLDDFVQRYVERHPSMLGIGRPARFVSLDQRVVGVDLVLRYEATEVWQDHLNARVGVDLGFRPTNVSQRRAADLDPGVRRRAVDFFGPEYDIWEHLQADGRWAPPRDHALTLA